MGVASAADKVFLYTKLQYEALLDSDNLKVYMYIRGFNMNQSNIFPFQSRQKEFAS